MITITLNENCGIKAEGLDIYASGVRKISCPTNIGTGRGVSELYNIPFNWCYGDASEWNINNTVNLKIENSVKNIMGQDFEMKDENGNEKYILSNGNKVGILGFLHSIDNYSLQIINEFFGNIGVVQIH